MICFTDDAARKEGGIFEIIIRYLKYTREGIQ